MEANKTEKSADAAAVTPAPVPPAAIIPSAEQIELEKLRAQNVTLQAALDEAKAATALGVAAKQANVPATKLGNSAQDLAHQRAVAACGGPAKWHQLDSDQRLQAQGQQPASPAEKEDCKLFFGKSSSAAAAQGLSKRDPARYARLRLVAKETGVLG